MKPLHRNLLIGARLLTLLSLVPFVSTQVHLAGVLWTIGSAPWLWLCTPRWLCLAIVLGQRLAADDFLWISRFGVVRHLTVLGGHALMGLVSLACLATVDRSIEPVTPGLRLLIVGMVIVVPLVVTGLLAVRCRVSETETAPSFTWRGLLAACALASVLTGWMINQRESAIQWHINRELATLHAQQRANEQRGLAELAVLRPDDPLARWLPFTHADTLAVSLRARAIVRARPHLTEELSALLRGSDAPARTEALRFVGGMITPLPAELIPPVRAALDAAAASLRERIAAQPDLSADALDADCLWAAAAAGNFPGSAADFINPLREIQVALARLPTGPEPHAGRSALDAWLHEHDPANPR